jgi:peptidoglycan/xylan/chitin deacetylase (PgdA/CDA1 family)
VVGVTALRCRLLPPHLYCFNYHRIGDPQSTEFNRGVFSCTAETFERQVRWLKSRFKLLRLAELSRLVEGGLGTRRPFALITFDDGYVDTYATAFPILRRHQVPAAFFLPTAYINSSKLPWWEELHWLLRRAAGRSIKLEGADRPLFIRTDDNDDSIFRIANFIKARATPLHEQMDEVRAACNMGRPAADAKTRLFLNWSEVHEMHKSSMDFGAHTHNHLILSHLDPETQREELKTSKEILEQQLGEPITAVSYPVGSSNSYTSETCNIAGEVGFKLGFTFRPHPNSMPIKEPLEIGRLAVDEDMGIGALRSMTCFPRLFGV